MKNVILFTILGVISLPVMLVCAFLYTPFAIIKFFTYDLGKMIWTDSPVQAYLQRREWIKVARSRK